MAHLRESPLQRGKDGVVAATGAPPYRLVALEILKSQVRHNSDLLFDGLLDLAHEERLTLDLAE